jgi:hypothetical protein
MAETVNIPTLKRGDTWRGRTITLEINGDPVDLTGAVVRMQVRTSATAPKAAEWSTVNDTITVTDAAGGVIRVEPRVVDLRPDTYQYDIEYTLEDGRVLTPIEGSWVITSDITR